MIINLRWRGVLATVASFYFFDWMLNCIGRAISLLCFYYRYFIRVFYGMCNNCKPLGIEHAGSVVTLKIRAHKVRGGLLALYEQIE